MVFAVGAFTTAVPLGALSVLNPVPVQDAACVDDQERVTGDPTLTDALDPPLTVMLAVGW